MQGLLVRGDLLSFRQAMHQVTWSHQRFGLVVVVADWTCHAEVVRHCAGISTLQLGVRLDFVWCYFIGAVVHILG